MSTAVANQNFAASNLVRLAEAVFSIVVLSLLVTESNAPKDRPAKTESAQEKSSVYKTRIAPQLPSVWKASVKKALVSKMVVLMDRSAKKEVASSTHAVVVSVVRANSVLLLMDAVS